MNGDDARSGSRDGVESPAAGKKPDLSRSRLYKDPGASGDEELDRIRNGTLGELEAILQDPDDPRYAKAKQVQDELFGPVIRSANALAASTAARLNEQVQKSLAAAMPKFPRITAAWDTPKVAPARDMKRSLSAGNAEAVEAIIDAIQLPPAADKTSPAEMRASAEAESDRALSLIASTSREHLEHARSTERDRKAEQIAALGRARRTEVAGWIAAAGALGAVVVGILTLIATQPG